MDDRTLKNGFRLGWILTLLAALFILGFGAFTYHLNRDLPNDTFDMGAKPFVPASSPYAVDYFEQEGQAAWDQEKEQQP